MNTQLKRTGYWLALIWASLGGLACSHDQDEPTSVADGADQSTEDAVRTERQALQALAQSGISVKGGGKAPTKLSGSLSSGAPAPSKAADDFVRDHAKALRVSGRDIASTMSPDRRTAHRTPVMYEPQTGKYKFVRISYGQARDGIPVYGARVDVLVRNEPGNPVVMATSNARSLGNFHPQMRGMKIDAQKARAAVKKSLQKKDFTGHPRSTVASGLDRFTGAEPVIWAGTRKAPAAPQLAVTYIAESSKGPERYRIVADAETGRVLAQQNLVVFEAVTGNVDGIASPDVKSLECSTPTSATMPYARIDHGTDSVFADATGSYSFDAPAGTPLTVESAIAGEYFLVQDGDSARNELLASEVTPPATQDFLHNPDNPDEYVLAQVNGYTYANQVRDWLLSYHPTFPTIASETAFPVNVNLTSGFCPGNAWYDYSSINFCASSSTFGNTSSGSVNHHEYGHHIVASAGSGQGAYGEGMADSIAMLIADDPGLGYGFYRDQCSTPLRTADNECQYSATSCSSCGSESHACGNLLSGALWDVRNALELTEPQDFLPILSNLTINSTLVHSGTSIDSQIATDFLTLDDDDGNIGNGTPHRDEICSGFEAHGLDCPELETGLSVSPETAFESVSEDVGGPFVPSNTTYTLENRGPDPLDFTASTDVSWIALDVTNGSLAVGETQDVLVSVDTEVANGLAVGTYTGTVTFDDVNDLGDDVTLPVSLQVGAPTMKYSWNLDVDPGWEEQGLWDWGVPQGGGGTYPDPTSGYTGDNVLGYNLAGNYESSLPETHLTSTPIDCSSLTDVSLRFRRWLGVESNSWDHASVSVSTDGTAWSTVWDNGANSLLEQQWTLQQLDISSIADGQSTVYVRFTMGTTDSTIQYGGWNLDDIEIWGYGEAAAECELDADCDDGAYCNGSESCEAGSCVAGTPVTCDDGIACTVDQCDEALDSCQSSPNHGACDDGAFCNGVEQCTESGCAAGTPPVCDDGIACTQDSCDSTVDACVFSPDDSVCDNDTYCDGAEVCSTTDGCMSGSLPCPDGTCDEETQSCSCQDVTYEAEDMFHSTGGSTSGGWNIWSNGYIETSHEFLGGSTTLSVIASGDEADGWPHMVVSVDGLAVGDVYVESSTWQAYEFTFEAAAGVQDIRVAFDNDYNGELGDRNLKVDAVTVVCGGSSEPSCTDGIQNGDETDVDCGGSTCSPCAEGQACAVDADCSVGTCQAGICTVESEPSCTDGIQNGDETDVDCGGSTCSPCAEGQACAVDADCSVGTCQAGICTTSTGDVTADVRMDNDWGSGYCASLELYNGASTATSSWTMVVDLNGAVMSDGWNGVFSSTADGFQVTPLDWNAAVQPGQEMTQVGFCANRSGGSSLPEVSSVSATF